MLTQILTVKPAIPERLKHVGTEDNPIFFIGTINTISVTITRSRKNSMEKVGGWHFALNTLQKLSWKDAASYDVTSESLCVLWRAVEPEALAMLLPELSTIEFGYLACQTKSNSEATAQRSDVQAHVLVAPRHVWEANDTLKLTYFIEPGKPNE